MSENIKLAAWKELLQRYRAVFRAAWDVRDELDPVERKCHEAAFLPAALELVKTPASPIPKLTARLLMPVCKPGL